jgi:hypothetical protein
MFQSASQKGNLEAENHELRRLLQELEHRLYSLHKEIVRSNSPDMPRMRDCVRYVLTQGPRVLLTKLRGKKT